LAEPLFDGTIGIDDPPPSDSVSVGRQVLRRELNDRLYVRANGSTQKFEVFCECGRRSCRESVKSGILVSPELYEKLRRVPTHFLIKHSHAAAADRVVDSHDGFLIVEKFGADGLAAIQLERAKHHLPAGSA
jgi:hypothetical protein